MRQALKWFVMAGVVTALAGCVAPSQGVMPPDRKVVPEFVEGVVPANWIPQMHFAYQDFVEAEGRDLDCFTVYLAVWQDEFHLSFSPNRPFQSAEQRKNSAQPAACGHGVNYRFDENRNFLGKNGIR